MKRDRRARVSFEDPDDENDEDDVVRHAPGSTAALVADVLAAEGAHKKRDESNADENAARATVLPSGRDSDDEEDAPLETEGVQTRKNHSKHRRNT